MRATSWPPPASMSSLGVTTTTTTGEDGGGRTHSTLLKACLAVLYPSHSRAQIPGAQPTALRNIDGGRRQKKHFGTYIVEIIFCCYLTFSLTVVVKEFDVSEIDAHQAGALLQGGRKLVTAVMQYVSREDNTTAAKYALLVREVGVVPRARDLAAHSLSEKQLLVK